MRTALLFLASAAALWAATGYKVVARYPVPGDGGFDYITLDQSARRLYVSHGTKVDVIDADSGQSVGTIGDTPGVHGVAIAAGLHRGFTSNGADNTVSVFDTQTLKVLRKIEVGKGPDGIYFDSTTGRVFTNNHGSHDVTAIDAASGSIAGTVRIGGDGEQPVFADGRFYLNVEDTDEVVVFDPKTLTVVKRMPIRGAKTPTGLAYDAATKRLFIACRNRPMMIVMDATNGQEVAKFPIGSGADWAHFDEATKLVFVSTGEGVLNVFHERSPNEYDGLEAIATKPSAKTMAFDRKTSRIYLPSVEYEPVASDSSKLTRRRIKHDSFAVLVVGQ